MSRTFVRDLKSHVGAEVELKGWLYNMRSKGKIHFLQLRDGSGIVQAVMGQGDVDAPTFALAATLTQESAIILRGRVKEDARAPGGVEVSPVTGLELVQLSQDYPLGKQAHGPDFLLSNRHLWLRSKLQHAHLRVRNEVIKAIRDFFYERGFVCVDAPIFTPAACEGTTTLFEVQYFEDKAYLTQSGQLYMEAAAMAHGQVYCFGPTFRAERSKTRRHLTEFWMVEPEMAFADLDDVMQLAQDFIIHVVRWALDHCQADLAVLERDVSKLEPATKGPYPRISYDEAVKLLQAAGQDFAWGGDLGGPDETIISQRYDRPVLIHRYPADVKAFYMKRDPQDERVALCVDVIAPEGVGEIIGGGQRADDLDYLKAQIQKHGLPEENFAWYLDLRRYGSVPHGGFGLGLERTVAWICGTEHVREAIPFPRMLYRIYP